MTASAHARTREELVRLTEGLRYALDEGRSALSAELAVETALLLGRVEERLGLGDDFTVVAFAGSTGSGKSSLFNAVSGLEIADVGVRRPTTSKPTACVWGTGGEEILDWLEVPEKNRTWRESALDGDDETDLHGLILVDLPDHDSTAQAHRLESDRMVGLVDVVFWVVDPQKYADYSLHSGYLASFAEHSTAMVFVLNQIDRLSPADRDRARAHLASLLREDGIEQARVHGASAVTRDGVPELRRILAETITAREAATERLLADVRTAAARVRAEIGEPPEDLDDLARAQPLVDAMMDAAGVDALVSTVREDYLRRAYRATGYPVLAWAQRSQADPLGAKHGSERSELLRAAAPEVTGAQSARVSLAAHELVEDAVAGLPAVWRGRIAKQERSSAEVLSSALDDALTAVPLERERPGWWSTARFFQILFFVCTVAGLLWVLVQGALVAFTDLEAHVLLWMVPAVLLVGGALGSWLTSAWAARARVRGAEAAASAVDERLRSAVLSAARGSFLSPITAVLDRHRRLWDAVR
ncbi:GTPase [Brevibacterium sp.]|mgnify:CR=1 FL=1|uniref:GTPase n=1 Tax=Brevibacterium sp. TaxID=1701 RepID=UPI0025BFBE60|nr:GTPase [Brevibacterium sp.]